MRLTAKIHFRLGPAGGPNPDNKELELIDESEDRLAYVNTVEEAELVIHEMLDVFLVEVEKS